MNNDGVLYKDIAPDKCAFKIDKPGDNSTIRNIVGPAIRYGDPATKDTQGDYFESDTEFSLGFPCSVGVFIDHGFNTMFGVMKITMAELYYGEDDISEGVFHKASLDIANANDNFLFSKIESGELGTSTGAVKHLVRYDFIEYGIFDYAFKVKIWPVGELSYSTKPADKRNWIQADSNTGKSEYFSYDDVNKILREQTSLKSVLDTITSNHELPYDAKIEALKMAGKFLVNKGIVSDEEVSKVVETVKPLSFKSEEEITKTLKDVENLLRK